MGKISMSTEIKPPKDLRPVISLFRGINDDSSNARAIIFYQALLILLDRGEITYDDQLPVPLGYVFDDDCRDSQDITEELLKQDLEAQVRFLSLSWDATKIIAAECPKWLPRMIVEDPAAGFLIQAHERWKEGLKKIASHTIQRL